MTLRRLRAILITLSLVLGVIGIGAGAASAMTNVCVSPNYGFSCVSFTGYSGQSTWGYPVDSRGHNCTNYAAYRLAQNGAGNPGNLGNAYEWDNNARAKGFAVDGNPVVGSIAQWESNHVAYVEAVTSTYVEITDDSYGGTTTRARYFRGQSDWPSSFIHIKDVVATPPAAKIVNTDFNRDTVPDIYAFNRNEGGTTVRIINGANVYQWLLQDSTILGTTGSSTDFAVDDYNGDGIPDLYAIQRNDAGSNSTAVRIINGANRQQWLLQSGTLLGQTGPETSFAVADYNQDGTPDIYAFQRNDTTSGHTAVRIINGANLYQWLLQSPMVLGVTYDNTEFAVGFYNGGNVPDIYAIQRDDAGSNSTAVRIINGANVYQWLLQTGTILGQTGQSWDFRVADYNRDGKSDLYAFNRNDAGSNSTSVHILNGNGFNSWLLQSGTLLGPTTSQWSFS